MMTLPQRRRAVISEAEDICAGDEPGMLEHLALRIIVLQDQLALTDKNVAKAISNLQETIS